MTGNINTSIIAVQHQLEPQNISEALKISEILAKAGAVPTKDAANTFAVIAAGREQGLGMMESFRCLYAFNGIVGMRAHYMMSRLAKARKDGICKYFIRIESDDTHAIFETLRDGDPAPQRETYTITDAERAGLKSKGGNYEKRPRTMLEIRAKTALIRLVFPEVLDGMYLREELDDSESLPEPVFKAAIMAPQQATDDPLATDATVIQASLSLDWDEPHRARMAVADSQAELKAIQDDIVRIIKTNNLDRTDPIVTRLRNELSKAQKRVKLFFEAATNELADNAALEDE